MFDLHVLGANLRAFRRAKGLKQWQVADELMVRPQSVSKWERGEAAPDIANLCALADLLQVSVDRILGTAAQEESAYVGIDGGGTKTEFVLVDERGIPRKRAVLGTSNPNAVGIEETCRVFLQGISDVSDLSFRIRGIFAGAAGLSVGQYSRQVRQALQRSHPTCTVDCGNDIRSVVACSSQRDNCIAAICGTGSVVWSYDGKWVRTGGNGYLFDKSGSGYDIGREGLSAALAQRDGSGPATRITALVEQRLGGTVWDRLTELYQSPPAQIASFAAEVFRAEQEGDGEARQIINANAARVAYLIRTAAGKAPSCRHVILAGGVVTGQTSFRRALLEKLPPSLTAEVLEGPPVRGACVLAGEGCGVAFSAGKEEFLEEYRALCAREEPKC